MNQKSSLYVVLGTGSDGKPHASRFAESQKDLAIKAAQLMNVRVGFADSPSAISLAETLPQGRIFPSGKAFAPLVKPDLFDKLVSQLKFEAVKPETAPSPTAPAQGKKEQASQPLAKTPDPWDQLAVGSVALYSGKKADDGWWEVVVLAVNKDRKTLTVRFDWPNEPSFKCQRQELGIIGPKAKRHGHSSKEARAGK